MTPAPTIEVGVSIERPTGTVRAGTASVTERRGQLSVTFRYHSSYLEISDARPISPELPLSERSTTTMGLPGAMADGAPDRWGRNLVTKRLQSVAREAGRGPISIGEIDFLLGVADMTRQGDLRYHLDDGPYLADHADVPKLIELPRLLHAAALVDGDGGLSDQIDGVKLLLDAGSGSLGGARPKASVRDGDRLFIAKFPHRSDEWDVIAWEKTALDLAEAAGITVPDRRLVDVGGVSVLLLERFDRVRLRRRGYVSAMTLLGRHDGDAADYVEIAEAMASVGARVGEDLEELWRRIAFSIVMNNTDDHLRNHGFLFEGGGWALAPAFDVNPNPRLGERSTSINYETSHRSARGALVAAAPFFGVTATRADEIWHEVVAATTGWQRVARANGISQREIAQFTDALDAQREG